MHVKIAGFTLDILVFYAERLGIHAEIKTKELPARKPSPASSCDGSLVISATPESRQAACEEATEHSSRGANRFPLRHETFGIHKDESCLRRREEGCRGKLARNLALP